LTIDEFDIAILGGGNAGMTLAAKLSLSSCDKSIIIFEPQSPKLKSATWSTWADDSEVSSLKPYLKGIWKRWKIVGNESEVVHESSDFSYIAVDATKYLEGCAKIIDDRVKLVPSYVETKDIPDGILLLAQEKRFTADLIFDSRPANLNENGLKQHFIGWEIEVNQALTETDTVTLMDFRADQSRGIHFIYALPLSENTLIVESTMLSKHVENDDWYYDAIEEWLTLNKLSIKKKLREERGVIPMHKTKSPSSDLIDIGVRGGSVRLSSGYSFSIVQQQANALVKKIINNDSSLLMKTKGYPLGFLDSVFNRVLLDYPSIAAEIFVKHSGAIDGNEFASFMRGSQNIRIWFKVMSALPKFIFIQSFFKTLFSYDHR